MKQKLHLKAPKNWINDPNGFIFYRGMYHLFYQCFPYAPRWGTMHWGHAVSRDLVSWEHKDIALFPTRYEDQNGCFSGSAVENGGKIYLFYTGVHYFKSDPDNVHSCLNDQFESAQLMITSDDGVRFDNFKNKKVVIPAISDCKIGDATHTRDPKVWRGKDAWYMVLGTSTPQRRGKLLIYRSKNLTDWELANTATRADHFGWMWECPDYFEVDGEKVLTFSPMGILTDGTSYQHQSISTIVDFDADTCKMTIPDHYQYFDYGMDLYAPQSTVDEEGRRVVVAWLRMPQAVDNRWNGMFCLPRVVNVKKGHIYFSVHPNVEKVYEKEISSVEEAGESEYRISLDINDGDVLNIGGYRVCRNGSVITADRTKVFPQNTEAGMVFSTPEVYGDLHIDVYVNKNLVEIYVNNGEYVLSNAVYGLTEELETNSSSRITIHTITV